MSSSINRISPRLGLIIPSSNSVMETEFNLLGKSKFSVHTTRIRLRKVELKELENMEHGLADAAQLLADADVRIIGYGCTSGSLFRGPGHDLQIEKSIRGVTGIPAVATSGCVVKALTQLRVRRVAVATPYTNEINRLEQQFLESSGFLVTRIRGLQIEDNLEIAKTKAERIYSLARDADNADAQALFISCTNLPTVGLVRRLEEILRKPVISSNTATLWSMLKTIKQDYSSINCGNLFQMRD